MQVRCMTIYLLKLQYHVEEQSWSFFFFSSRRRHTRYWRDWGSDVCSSDLVLVIDETGFLKQGQHSCGVGRQYTGSAGKITKCQIGVFAAYASDKGCAFIDRKLYLPQEWINSPSRRAAAHVPDDIRFATKPQIAAEMIERALGAGVPFDWVAA